MPSPQEICRVHALFGDDEVFIVRQKAAGKDQNVLLILVEVTSSFPGGLEDVQTASIEAAYCRSSVRESGVIAKVQSQARPVLASPIDAREAAIIRAQSTCRQLSHSARRKGKR